jgi:hypothetical protein
MAARKKSKKTSGKRGKPAAKRAPAKPARPKAKAKGKARPAAKRGEGDASLVYSDIRRTLHGAILRSLR